MSPDRAREPYERYTALVRQWRRPLLVSHAKPDGDALGSLVAMRAMLKQIGVSATALLYEPVPVRYSVFNPAGFAVLGRDVAAEALDSFDSAMVLDTCTYNQLEPVAKWLSETRVPKLAVDHHRTRDDLANEYLIDESAAANCLILFDWAKSDPAAWKIERNVAEALFVGIATDTGWFRHSNTDHRVLTAAADLVACGVDAHELFERLYLCDTEARVRLLAAALVSLELHADGKVSLMSLPRETFERTGATRGDTEDIINEPLRIATVVVSLLFVEQEDGVVRVSLRSRSPAPGTPDIDVAKVAQTLGGGGHSRAAGVRLPGPVEGAKQRVLQTVMPRIGR